MLSGRNKFLFTFQIRWILTVACAVSGIITTRVLYISLRIYDICITSVSVADWSLTLREERRLDVYENRVLRRIFGPKRDDITGSGENYIMRSLMVCTLHHTLFG
jgi:hypothetical protein